MLIDLSWKFISVHNTKEKQFNSRRKMLPNAKQASMRNGAVFPKNWYMNPPKGGPTWKKNYNIVYFSYLKYAKL